MVFWRRDSRPPWTSNQADSFPSGAQARPVYTAGPTHRSLTWPLADV